MKKQIAAFLLAAGLGAVPAAFAQDKMQDTKMSQDKMEHDKMSGEKMSKKKHKKSKKDKNDKMSGDKMSGDKMNRLAPMSGQVRMARMSFLNFQK